MFSTGDTIMIKGIAVSDTNSIIIKIFDQNDQLVVTLGTFISSDAFSLPWTVPSGFDTGTYTIIVTDGANTASFEIFIQ